MNSILQQSFLLSNLQDICSITLGTANSLSLLNRNPERIHVVMRAPVISTMYKSNNIMSDGST